MTISCGGQAIAPSFPFVTTFGIFHNRCRVLRPAKLPAEKPLRSIRWSNIRVSGEPVYLPILPPIKRFQIKVIESVHNTWGILRWDGAMCEAPNISNAVARRAEAPGSWTADRTSDVSTSQCMALSKPKLVVEAESQHGVVVWSSAQKCPPTFSTDSYPLQLIVLPGEEIQRHLPETLHVEATGLGGRDLSYPIPWDISIRWDKEGQSVYGPSLAPMEEPVSIPAPFGGSQTLQVTVLGRSKAAHEFLVLHYFSPR